jgi:hypothetical protein
LRPFAHPLYNDISEHKVTLKWERGRAEFSYQKYPRDHTWSFDGGHTMTATAAPAYLGNPANVDPEEAFVASLSSCHMYLHVQISRHPVNAGSGGKHVRSCQGHETHHYRDDARYRTLDDASHRQGMLRA